MSTKTTSSPTDVEKTIAALSARVDALESAMAASASLNTATATNIVREAVLLERLDRLTLKRHAVLTATLASVSYRDIAKYMSCDETTVKLQLRAVLDIFDIQSRGFLLVSWENLLDGISDQEYEQRFGISKTWWQTQKPGLMAVLRASKPANNQHTK
jgi:hypothetical protein